MQEAREEVKGRKGRKRWVVRGGNVNGQWVDCCWIAVAMEIETSIS